MNKLIKCSTCGYIDTEKYCSRCGNELQSIPNLWTPTYKNLLSIIGEFSLEIINPVFSFFKTGWLLIASPELFFECYFLKTKPMSEIYFPLEKLWRKLNKDGHQNILSPTQFYLASLAPSFLLTIIVSVLGGITQLEKALVNELLLTPINESGTLIVGAIFLLYPLCVAFIFDVFTENDPIPYKFKYVFWVYIFGLLIVAPSIFMIFANIPFIPNYAIFAIIDYLASNIDPETAGTLTQANYELVKSFYSTPQDIILGVMTFCFLGVIPYNVFGRIYNISRRRLILALIVSTIAPVFFLYISYSTCCAPIFMLFFGVVVYNFFKTKKR